VTFGKNTKKKKKQQKLFSFEKNAEGDYEMFYPSGHLVHLLHCPGPNRVGISLYLFCLKIEKGPISETLCGFYVKEDRTAHAVLRNSSEQIV
jgi:hypothetical protein